MQDSNEVNYSCKYGVSQLIFMLEDKKIECDHSNILSIEYLNDYENNIRAILKVSIRVDIRKKLWLLKNKSKIVCKFQLSKKGMDVDNDTYITVESDVWNIEFGIYFDDDNESIDLDLMEERIKMNEGGNYKDNDIENENLFESQNILDVYLFENKLLKASNYSYNEVFTSDTLQQIVGRMLSESKHPKVLASRFENDEIYSELLVPVNPLYKCLIYLDQYYGFYKKGAIIYYDLDTLYIINPNDKCDAKRDKEFEETTFLVTKLNSSIPGDCMVYKQGEKVHYCKVSEQSVNTKQFSILNNASQGSTAKIVSVDTTNIQVEDAEQSFIDNRNEKIMYVRENDNKFTNEIVKARMEENEVVLYISANNLDVSAFTPNKIFQVVFEETTKQEKYGKNKYRLAYAYHMIRIEGESHMSSTHRIVLKKATS